MKRLISISILILSLAFTAYGQSAIVKEFTPVCDSLAVLLHEHNSVKWKLELKAVMKRGAYLDFYFTESLGDYPWYESDVRWFRSHLRALFPEKYKSYRLGDIYSKRIAHDKLVTPALDNSGHPSVSRHRIPEPDRRSIVKRLDGLRFDKGLEGRHIALWQSHGYYYDQTSDRWQWQRPCLFQTVEDMFTQSFVLPYLAPMLENAGAYTLIPRERDIQRHEVIADNDSTDIAYGKSTYSEKGKWKDAGTGFAALKPVYEGLENPFEAGSARQLECVQNGKRNKASITWCPEIPERGEYAVYVSYKSLPKSTSSALYTVRHLGGETKFVVNQKIGGGTWIYLGTFEFGKGSDGCVILTNETPKDYRFHSGSIVSADAVKFGGGMGNIARTAKESDLPPVVSGMPRYAEGARYWLQWAGVPSDIYSQNEEEHDYRDDFMSRGDWVEWISRGSYMNPSKTGPGVPIDLSFGMHSDAGLFPDDSLVGTLSIYTLRSEGVQKLPAGESRMTSREYADLIQSQVVSDLRVSYDSLWPRRAIWDRGYRESRTPSSPAMLLELLSHQNFADMKYGLDPSFRFTVSRSIYKGMLKYLSNRYGVPYAVQPLPVTSIGVTSGKDGKAVISWIPAYDEAEPTADPKGYILYTRIDNGAFDNGTVVSDLKKRGSRLYTEVQIKPGQIYSFRIASFNDGGKSFDSETVSIGIPSHSDNKGNVLIVNNFDRISGPAFHDTPEHAGFNNTLDSGVPHIRDIAYIGDMHQFRRDSEYLTNDNPGFGASYSDYAGYSVSGNTFDFPYVHGKAILKAGHSFTSCSNEAFCTDSTFRAGSQVIDLICGKQVTTAIGAGGLQKYDIFPTDMQQGLEAFAAKGGNIIVSGSYIGRDVWDSIYPVKKDSLQNIRTMKFAKEVLGYKWAAGSASRKGSVRIARNKHIPDSGKSLSICNHINTDQYSVESPDGIAPASEKGSIFMRYEDTGIPAGICHEGNGYKTACLGFPLEAIVSETDMNNIIRLILEYFNK